MKMNLVKRLRVENSNSLKTSSSLEQVKAKKVLEFAKSLNRPVKFLDKGFSTEWLKEQKKISNKKY